MHLNKNIRESTTNNTNHTKKLQKKLKCSWFLCGSLLNFLIFFAAPFFCPAQGENGGALPEIVQLNLRDDIFKQYQSDVDAGRQAVRPPKAKAGAQAITGRLTIYAYMPKKDDGLLQIAARCNIPYDSIITLNRLQGIPVFPSSRLLLPSVPGIFIPDTPKSDLEFLIASGRGGDAGVPITVNSGGQKMSFRFIPGDDLSPNERAFFLNPGLFRFPLKSYVITSPFGIRQSPISGKTSIHNGMDLAAPSGTPVYAARDGTVSESGQNSVYGKYIIISHDGNWSSLYGHLSSIEIDLRSVVKSGTLIGKVGSTGLSTGPHLHFELRQNGKAQDPSSLLMGRK